MKRFLTAAVCGIAVLALAAGAAAQTKKTGGAGVAPGRLHPIGVQDKGHMRMGMLERLQKELNLTPDQVTKIKAIIANGRAQMKALRGGGKPAKGAPISADIKAKMKAIHENTMREVRNVLTPAQRLKFDEMMKHRKRIK